MRWNRAIDYKSTRTALAAVIWAAMLVTAVGQNLRYGAERERLYVPELRGKRVAVVAHAASVADGEHTVDRLMRRGVDVRFVFTPEHGFRGTASAGEKVEAVRDSATGLRLISLYGERRKPSKADLDSVDAVVYDLQDLSIRFYTYVSTLAYVMEACAEHGKTLVVLDRPTPFADVVDGPILDTALHRSFVGLHPVPVLYGLTSAEYALMAKGERWVRGADSLELLVVPVEHYRRERIYPSSPPSPNLATRNAIDWYPSLCFFEATDVSVGRGTDFAFEQYGAPWWGDSTYFFVPRSRVGATKPPHEGDTCLGVDLRKNPAPLGIDWSHLWEAKYRYDSVKVADTLTVRPTFARSFLNRLSGTSTLMKALDEGWTPLQFRAWYFSDVMRYNFARQRYVLYESATDYQPGEAAPEVVPMTEEAPKQHRTRRPRGLFRKKLD